jgi:hypothetical protein
LISWSHTKIGLKIVIQKIGLKIAVMPAGGALAGLEDA